MFRKINFFAIVFSIPLIGSHLTAQPDKPSDKHHVKVKTEGRETLDRFTGSVRPVLPGGASIPVQRNNYIDDYIFNKMDRNNIPRAPLSSDTEFLRRVTLDLTGRLPEVEAIRKFVKDTDPSKRGKLIDSLVATSWVGLRGRLSTPFVDRWTYWFGDLFRTNAGHNNVKGRAILYDHIYNSLLENLPYDEFVRTLLTSSSRSNWTNGPINYYARDYVNATDDDIINNEDTYDQWAISSYKLFLGVNLECISCHQGAGHLENINSWLSKKNREEFWNQAAFFSESRLWRPYGNNAHYALTEDGKGYDLTSASVTRMQRYPADVSPTFLFTGEKPRPGENFREAYARILTGSPQFARATVNLFWAELMGVGIVDPPFEFDLDRQDPNKPPPAPWTIQPSHPKLLDALAEDFKAHDYDLRYLITLITKSSVYQLSSRFEGEWRQEYAKYFARHFARRLTAAQIWDALSQSTGLYSEIPIAGTNRKVKYIGKMIGPDDLGSVKPLRDLLESFGLYNRYAVGDDSSGNRGSIIQASILLNNPLVQEKLRAQKGGRLHDLLNHEPHYDNSKIIEELFLATISRFPTEKEKEMALRLIQDYRTQGAEDLLWTLINKLEFIGNL